MGKLVKKFVAVSVAFLFVLVYCSKGVPYLDVTANSMLNFSVRSVFFDVLFKSDRSTGIKGLSAGESSVFSTADNKNNEATVSEVTNESGVAGDIVTVSLDRKGGNLSYKNIFVNNRTAEKLELESIYENEENISLAENDEPQVLIMHTHATEAYTNEGENTFSSTDGCRSSDPKKSVIAVGTVIAEKLNAVGIKTIHDETKHDETAFNGSYSRAEETIKSYLEKYPSIKIVIDCHRDSIDRSDGTKVRPVVEINGKKAAQIMFVTGCGNDSAPFENWRQNMSTVMKLQEQCETDYPGLARAIYFVKYRYNLHLTPGSMLIEFGADGNTLEQAKYSAELFSKTVIKVMKK